MKNYTNCTRTTKLKNKDFFILICPKCYQNALLIGITLFSKVLDIKYFDNCTSADAFDQKTYAKCFLWDGVL